MNKVTASAGLVESLALQGPAGLQQMPSTTEAAVELEGRVGNIFAVLVSDRQEPNELGGADTASVWRDHLVPLQ